MWVSEVKFQHAATRAYLGSPSLLRMPDGYLLATHDYFGVGCPKNHEGEAHLSSVYRSRDDGRTWENLTHISGAFWSTLFHHRGAVYLLGTSVRYGSIVIRRSEDGGCTWTHPGDAESGLLFRGGPGCKPPNYHCAPMPVLEADGRLYRAFEDNDPCHWPRGFRALVISAPADADLLHAENWRMSNSLAFDQDADPPEFGRNPQGGCGWLEGNVVREPDGVLWDVLRLHATPVINQAAFVRIEDEGARVTFDPATGFRDFPGGQCKFTVRREGADGLYWAVANDVPGRRWTMPTHVARCRLSLFCSADLRVWRRCRVLLDDNLEPTFEDAVRNTGFQYADWRFDGEDLIYLVRTAYDGAARYHDANRITFGRVREFQRLRARAELWPVREEGGPGAPSGTA